MMFLDQLKSARARRETYIGPWLPEPVLDETTLDSETASDLAHEFVAAAQGGDMAALTRLLADDAVLVSDGGGKRRAALNPIHRADRIARFVLGILRKSPLPASTRLRAAMINGMPGFVVADASGERSTIAFAVADERIAAIYLVVNPDKLQHVPV